MGDYKKRVDTGVAAGILIGSLFLVAVLFLLVNVERKSQNIFFIEAYNMEEQNIENI